MSLSDNVKNLRFKNMDKDLRVGKTPQSCEVVSESGNNIDLMPFSMPRDKSVLQFKTGEKIATYRKCIDAWVMEKGLSPDLIPQIKNRPTISYEQYSAMRERAMFLQENKYRYGCYELGRQDGYRIYTADDFDAKHQCNVVNRQLNTSPAIKQLLKSMEKTPSVEDVYKYSKTKGENKDVLPKHDPPFHITVDDVMHCVFGTAKRDKSFERPIAELEAEYNATRGPDYYGIGDDTIHPDVVEDWANALSKGERPPFLRVLEKDTESGKRISLNTVPENPIEGVHTIEYFYKPVAKFTNGKWEIGIPSMDDRYPPLTSKEIPVIGGVQTVTSAEVLEQIAQKDSESIDDLIDSKNSDINNDNNIQKEIRDIDEEIM